MFVEVHAIVFAILGKPKESLGIEGIEDREGDTEGGEVIPLPMACAARTLKIPRKRDP